MYMMPELIATQLTTGAGPGPMNAVATSCFNLATAYLKLTDDITQLLQRLVSNWSGEPVPRIQEAVGQLLAVLQSHQALLENSNARTLQQSSAFVSAVSSIVPLAQIVENRTALVVAQDTNAFGENSAEIIRLTIEYAEYTAQNNAIMSAYHSATMSNMEFGQFFTVPQLATSVPAPPISTYNFGPMMPALPAEAEAFTEAIKKRGWSNNPLQYLTNIGWLNNFTGPLLNSSSFNNLNSTGAANASPMSLNRFDEKLSGNSSMPIRAERMIGAASSRSGAHKNPWTFRYPSGWTAPSFPPESSKPLLNNMSMPPSGSMSSASPMMLPPLGDANRAGNGLLQPDTSPLSNDRRVSPQGRRRRG